jgi:hypothetical protein
MLAVSIRFLLPEIRSFLDNELTQETLVVFCDVLEENQMLTSILLNGIMIRLLV